MYEEIKITGVIGDGSIAEELNKISKMYDVITLLGFSEDSDEFYFLVKRKFNDTFYDKTN